MLPRFRNDDNFDKGRRGWKSGKDDASTGRWALWTAVLCVGAVFLLLVLLLTEHELLGYNVKRSEIGECPLTLGWSLSRIRGRMGL
jgi:hypothetical protein